MTDAQTQLLIAVRESAAALVMAIDGFVDAQVSAIDDANSACLHPVESRIDASAMGLVRYQCGVCKDLVEMGDE